MQTINRNLLYVKAKEPLAEWLTALDPENPTALEEFEGHDSALVFLIPEFESYFGAMNWLEKEWQTWFDQLLYNYWTNENDWPKNRNWKMLNSFFDIQYQSLILDTVITPVKKEEE